MKNMFLASSFADVSPLLTEYLNTDFTGKTITFIPTASLPEDFTSYVSAAKIELEKLGMLIDELEISTASSAEIKTKLENNDYIYITGGNSFFLLQELKRTGADQLIIEQINQGKLYIGESAGAIITAPTINYITAMDDQTAARNLANFKGLNLVRFHPVPHHTNQPFANLVAEIITNYQALLPLKPLSNSQAILITGETSQLIGE